MIGGVVPAGTEDCSAHKFTDSCYGRDPVEGSGSEPAQAAGVYVLRPGAAQPTRVGGDSEDQLGLWGPVIAKPFPKTCGGRDGFKRGVQRRRGINNKPIANMCNMFFINRFFKGRLCGEGPL